MLILQEFYLEFGIWSLLRAVEFPSGHQGPGICGYDMIIKINRQITNVKMSRDNVSRDSK